ncbi:hypothetical protein CPB85DRAFT_1252818 [Mucidula mucida]|nr:hypothetical protein CPB85DRAFT_1252818 [Mucidula mucida]
MKASAKEAERRAFDEENAYFWKTTLNDTQKALLKTFNINTFTELCEASDAAEMQLRSPPYPDIGQLRPRLRHAYTIFHEALYSDTAQTERLCFHPKSRFGDGGGIIVGTLLQNAGDG